MRERNARRAGRPDLHLPSVLGRARADLWPLVVAVVVVAVTVLLACVTPVLAARTADAAVREAVLTAGGRADLVIGMWLDEDRRSGRGLHPDTAADIAFLAERLDDGLTPELADHLDTPVAAVTGVRLKVVRDADGGAGWAMRLVHLWHDGAPAVTWLSGGPGGASSEPLLSATQSDGRPWPVQVALSEAVAQTLDVLVGDTVPLRNSDGVDIEAQVTGIFRAVDPQDPVWRSAPDVLDASTRGTGITSSTLLAGLVSAQALPFARLAVGPTQTSASITFPASPASFSLADVDPVTVAVAGMQVAPSELRLPGRVPSVDSGLATVLLDVRAQVRAAQAQASVIVAAVVTVAALSLLLVATLLVRRRRAVLTSRRARGGSLLGVGLELTLESVVVTALGVSLGALGARDLVGSAVTGGATTPAVAVVAVAAVSVLATPLAGAWFSSRTTGGRRGPVDRTDARRRERQRRIRLRALEGAGLLATVGAVGALRARGLGAGTGPDPLVALAPTAAVAAGAVLLVHAARPTGRVLLGRATRSPRIVPVLAAARARTGHVLGLLALAVASGLVALTSVVGATVHVGQEAGSWDATGADVAVELNEPDPGLPALADDLLTHDGVAAALTARVDDGAQVRGPGFGRRIRLVVVDAVALAALTEATPLTDVRGELLTDRAAAPGTPVGAALPVLVSPALRAFGDDGLTLQWDGARLPLAVTGTATAPGGGNELTLIVDAAAFGRATGTAADPDTLWVTGPGADQALRSVPALSDAHVSERSAWLAERRAAPLAVGLTDLVLAATGVLLLLTVIVVTSSAAVEAPERASTLARLRTLGLTGRQVWRISAGEMLPGVVLACVGGSAVGLAVAQLCLAPLDLGRLTGQSGTPALVVPWQAVAPLLVGAATVVVVVAVEQAARRRERLGQTLRIG